MVAEVRHVTKEDPEFHMSLMDADAMPFLAVSLTASSLS
jgi:hypothetical protein